jgi:tRNA(Ile)-lysidine synthase
MLRRGELLGVAVSGGADSVCLLHALAALAPLWEARLSVLHVNHLLRGAESGEDARFVAELARARGFEFHLRSIEVAAAPGNLEQAARRARHAFFHELIAAGAVTRVATGHTLSDQAETVLFRLLRGAGPAGLRGILPVTADGLVRPLLGVERAAVLDWLTGRGLEWRQDATNADRRFARNRLRHDWLPVLAQAENPRLGQALANLAQVAQAEEEFWEARLPRLAARVFRAGSGAWVCRSEDLLRGGEAVARRLVRHVLGCLRGDLLGLEFEHVEAVLALARTASGDGGVTLPGAQVDRSFGWLRFALSSPAPESWSHPVEPPCRLESPAGTLEFELLEALPEGLKPGARTADYKYNEDSGLLDWQAIPGPLTLRGWRPGDRFRPADRSVEAPVKRLFQKHRIPHWERGDWPVLEAAGQIVWVRRLGAASVFAAGPGSRKVLRVRDL